MNALPKIQEAQIELAVYSRSDARPQQVVHHLCTSYPFAMTARKLMGFSGFASHRDPVTPFVEFINIFNRINVALAPLGWQATRTGGTPDDLYRLMPVN